METLLPFLLALMPDQKSLVRNNLTRYQRGRVELLMQVCNTYALKIIRISRRNGLGVDVKPTLRFLLVCKCGGKSEVAIFVTKNMEQ